MTPDDIDRPQAESAPSGPTLTSRFVFPRWTNRLREASAVIAVGALVYAVVVITGVFSPEMSATGYAPEQPVPYSHALHVGQLGIDCRYCHTSVETAARANVPPTATCLNCHRTIKTESELLAPVRASEAANEPLQWICVHDLPDFVYFNHAGHIQSGVGCKSCHGRIDRLEVVYQAEGLNMSWCLRCHREPEAHLRPLDKVTVMDWRPDGDPEELGARLRQERGVDPSTDCGTCHR